MGSFGIETLPVLVEIGATCPTRGLFLLDSEYSAGDELEGWVKVAAPQVRASRS